VSAGFPPDGAIAERLSNVAERRSDDEFVVSSRPMGVSHWDGQKWSSVHMAADPGRPLPQALAALPTGALWAAGLDQSFDVFARVRQRVFHLCGQPR
jgi:hypothetical protein